jgi:hypothetical protein
MYLFVATTGRVNLHRHGGNKMRGVFSPCRTEVRRYVSVSNGIVESTPRRHHAWQVFTELIPVSYRETPIMYDPPAIGRRPTDYEIAYPLFYWSVFFLSSSFFFSREEARTSYRCISQCLVPSLACYADSAGLSSQNPCSNGPTQGSYTEHSVYYVRSTLR